MVPLRRQQLLIRLPRHCQLQGLVLGAILLTILAMPRLAAAQETRPAPAPAEVTLSGSLCCNGACLPDPKTADHVPVLFAIGGTLEVQAEVAQLMARFNPDQGLDAAAAQMLMDEFGARLKYYLAPESPALKHAGSRTASHYCAPAAASSVTGVVTVKDGRRWIIASRIEPARLVYPAKMLAPDKPFIRPRQEPLVLKINDQLSLKCIAIPPGKFLMGTPFYMWPYYQEEYPHLVTLTKPFYMAEIPVTQEMYVAVMGSNPSMAKDPQLPVENPRFADLDRFCRLLSETNGRRVRLPTDAEWEYAARVGTSNPPFPPKYQDQNSSGPDGFRAPLKVKSRQPNAWGLYDMASCWWEITADRSLYNVRHDEVDPRYPPSGPDPAKVQRSGRGIVKDHWSLATHEFINEKGYAGQKFRVVVEAEVPATAPGTAQ